MDRMLIRKNTKPFKVIHKIITACKDKPNRKDLVRLYITKAGHSIKDRIGVEALQGNSDAFYDITYNTVLNNLTAPGRQLHQSDSIPGIYFFQTNTNKAWDETPFEFDESVKKEFSNEDELPVLRKKEAVKPYVLPVANTASKQAGKQKPALKNTPVSFVVKKTVQPNYGLKQKVEFTDLGEIIFAEGAVTKKDVLDYYHKIAAYILPYIKDRPLSVKPGFAYDEFQTLDKLAEYVDVPEWIQKSSRKNNLLVCNDKEHLLWYVETGCIEFCCRHSTITSPDSADFSVIAINSTESNVEDVLAAAKAAQIVLEGLQLPSYVKTDGHGGLLIYLPLDTKSAFDASTQLAQYVSKLIRLKAPELMSVYEPDIQRNSKISLDYLRNEPGKYWVAPYSLISRKVPVVAAPVSWKTVEEGFDPAELDYKTIFKNLDRDSDWLKKISKRKTDVRAALKRLEANYSFLM
jgi:DNA ligase D-like protein (predicted polymerase)